MSITVFPQDQRKSRFGRQELNWSLIGLAILIPSAVTACGVVTKKISRGPGWKTTDFFLGRELSLSALAAALTYLVDLSKYQPTNPLAPTTSGKMADTSYFLAICFFLLLFIVSIHQDWERRDLNAKGRFISLGLVGNFLGLALLAGFVILVKRS